MPPAIDCTLYSATVRSLLMLALAEPLVAAGLPVASVLSHVIHWLPTSEELRAAVVAQANGDSRAHKCSHCCLSFNSAEKLAEHLPFHRKGGAAPLMQLVTCGATPPASKAGLTERQVCPDCMLVAQSRQALKRHFARKHMAGNKLYPCTKCHTGFMTSTDLQEHAQFCFSGEDAAKIAVCRSCGLNFTNLKAWKKHKTFTFHREFDVVAKARALAEQPEQLSTARACVYFSRKECLVDSDSDSGGSDLDAEVLRVEPCPSPIRQHQNVFRAHLVDD